MDLGALPQKACFALVCLKKNYLHTCPSGNLSPQSVQKPGRLFFHSLQFAVRHFALQFIPNGKGCFQIGVAQECLRLFFRQGAVCYEGFD